MARDNEKNRQAPDAGDAAAQEAQAGKTEREQAAKTNENDQKAQVEKSTEAAREAVYAAADAQSGADNPLGPSGDRLTTFEMQNSAFFARQNEFEAKVDEAGDKIMEGLRENGVDSMNVVRQINLAAVAGEEGAGPLGSATQTYTATAEIIYPYPPVDYAGIGTAQSPYYVTTAIRDADPELAKVVTSAQAAQGTTYPLTTSDLAGATDIRVPMPPENDHWDKYETDGRVDQKDYMRRLRVGEFTIDETRRSKYPATVEDPAP